MGDREVCAVNSSVGCFDRAECTALGCQRWDPKERAELHKDIEIQELTDISNFLGKLAWGALGGGFLIGLFLGRCFL
jgi:hypothetical protein